MSFKKDLGFDDRIAMLIGIPVVSLISPVVFLDFRFQGGVLVVAISLLVSLVYTCFYWLGNREIMRSSHRRYPYFEQTKHRLFRQLPLMLLFTSVACTFLNNLLTFITGDPFPHIPTIPEVSAGVIITISIGALYESVYFFGQLKRSIEEKELLLRENVQAQLDTLKNQVNPHFLFNSLNTLVALIPENPEKSIQFVEHLSKAYRSILEMKDKSLVTLEEELSCLGAYIFLLQERFGENLIVENKISTDFYEKRVVPLSLQILLENAVKHNIISKAKPLHILIFYENGRLVVRNTLQRKTSVIHSTGTGLKNIKNRYSLLSGKEIETIISSNYFTVTLPLLEPPL